jgi:hypothetical protein
MKRHYNWQEWGKRRALQHMMNRAVEEMTIKGLTEEVLATTNPFSRLFGPREPFVSREMRIPIQYKSAEPQCAHDSPNLVSIKYVQVPVVKEEHS